MNHFIEVDIDEKAGKYILVVHTGSRNFGLKVAEYHQNEAKKLMNEMFIGDAYKGLEFLPMERGGHAYLQDMHIAQSYAAINRETIVQRIFEQLVVRGFITHEAMRMSLANMHSCVHNYIDGLGTVRKGAIAAHDGCHVIIPLNMRDGVIFGIGKGSAKWNNSAPHGAGRILSRSKAKESLVLADYKTSMDGIYTSCVNQDTIDEAPMAYKPAEMILRAIEETVEIQHIAKPCYNFKAGGE